MTRTVGFVLFPGFQILDATGPLAAFDIAGRFADRGYRIRLFAREPGLVATSTPGIALPAEGFEAAGLVDTLVVVGGDGVRSAAADPALIAFVSDAAARARRVASVCSGTFVLAAAGLLDGRRATTHWSRSAAFAKAYPRVRLEPDRIFVKDGPVWSSAGITAGIDLALAMVAEDLGEAVAKRTAQQLVVYRRRPGGQSQFSALLELDQPGGRFAPLMGWMGERLGEPLGVERLAREAAMSPRNFARAFLAETGVTPAKAVERLRVEAARERIEAGSEPIEQVAAATGFGDQERMRRAFVRAFGQPPQALRRAARA
jgi:transcriptional regulator GlxA family with amidase domain